ncbi:MAG: release factor H-coupled RctB family protein [Myxococcota bacterium]|jgi:release factor H-coupled RctB family protein
MGPESALGRRAWCAGRRPVVPWSDQVSGLAVLAESEPELPPLHAPPPDDPTFGTALGSIGGGNHFLEASRVSAVSDKATASTCGLRPGGFAVLAHSGSRGLGAWLSRRWSGQVLDGAVWDTYRDQLGGAVRFAAANRLVLCWRMLRALGVARPGAIAGGFDVVHNTAEPLVVDGVQTWVFRKGSAPAALGQPTVGLGSRGAPSHVLLGLGQTRCLCSVAHRAGRRYGGSDAAKRFGARHTRASLRRTDVGSRGLCEDSELLYSEHPDAYKNVGSVVDALTRDGAASPVAELTPLITVKR